MIAALCLLLAALSVNSLALGESYSASTMRLLRYEGEVTIEDAKLYDYLLDLWNSEGIFIEPSACAAFQGIPAMKSGEMQRYIDQHQLRSKMGDATHIAWATGGKLVPGEERRKFLGTYL